MCPNVAVISRVDAKGAEPGDSIHVKLTKVDVAKRQIAFERID